MYLKDLLTKEQNDIRQALRKFVDKEIMPIREKLETDYSLVESVHQKLVGMGIQKAGYPEEYGGGGSHLGHHSRHCMRGIGGEMRYQLERWHKRGNNPPGRYDGR